MGLLHAFHFDAGVIPPDFDATAGVAISTVQKRTGNYSLKMPANYAAPFADKASFTLSAPQSEFFLQFALRYGGTHAGYPYKIVRWQYGSTILGGLELSHLTHRLQLYTGNFSTLVATSSTALAINTWYVIELHIKIADSGGVLNLRIDTNDEMTFSGDTKPGSENTVDIITFGSNESSNVDHAGYLDDIIIHDTAGSVNNSWPDGARVAYLLPAGDGSSKEWTPSAGSDHYAVIDEIPPSGADYLQATAVDKVSEVTLTSLPGDAQVVKGVIAEAYAFKGSTTEPTTLELGIDVGGGASFSADKTLALTQGIVRNIWEEKPGGGAFSVADINNMNLLFKSAA